MFVYLDNEEFLVNNDCPVVVLMQYIKTRLQLAESGTALSMLSLIHQDYVDNQNT